MDKIKIIQAANQLGLGGTEYCLQQIAQNLNRDVFEVTVISLFKGGERVKVLQDSGIKVIICNGNYDLFEEEIRKCDVLHFHSSGAVTPDFYRVLKRVKPSLVLQTNVFGEDNAKPFYDVIDFDFFVSKMILYRVSQKSHEAAFDKKRFVLYNPVDFQLIQNNLPSTEDTELLKEKYGLQGKFVVGRVGRADDSKFDLKTLDGFKSFTERVPNSMFVLVGATKKMQMYAKKIGIFPKVLFLDPIIDFKLLIHHYKLFDCFLAISRIGESFGMVIAESMSCGVPVVTVSTPTRDNAQIELVDNMVNGVVTYYNAKMVGDAIMFLYLNREKRIEFGKKAAEKVHQTYDSRAIIDNLSQFILEKLGRQHSSYPLIQNYSNLIISDYTSRCLNLFTISSPLSLFFRLLPGRVLHKGHFFAKRIFKYLFLSVMAFLNSTRP